MIFEYVQQQVEQVIYDIVSNFEYLANNNLVTLVSAFTIMMLILFEVIRFMTPIMQSEIIVDGGIMVKEIL